MENLSCHEFLTRFLSIKHLTYLHDELLVLLFATAIIAITVNSVC